MGRERGEAGAGVDVGGASDERAGSEVGGKNGAGATGGGGRVDDADRLDAAKEGRQPRTGGKRPRERT